MSYFRYTPTLALIYAAPLMLFVERVRHVSSIVFLDDEERDLIDCAQALHPRAVHTTTRVAEVFDLVERVKPDLLLVDFFLGEQRGYAPDGSSRRKDSLAIRVVSELRALHGSMQILVVSNGSCDPFRSAVKAAGADAMIHKLVGWQKIIDIVECNMLREPAPPAKRSLELQTYEALARSYVDNNFNASKAARELAIERSTFYRKIKAIAPRK